MSTMDSAKVRLVMTREVLGIVPSAPLEVALRMMVEAKVRHLPVIDGGHCLGLLYESDVLWRLWSTVGSQPPDVGAVARTPVLSVASDAPVWTVARRLVAADADAAVVVDSNRIVGIVTAFDMMRLVADATE